MLAARFKGWSSLSVHTISRHGSALPVKACVCTGPRVVGRHNLAGFDPPWLYYEVGLEDEVQVLLLGGELGHDFVDLCNDRAKQRSCEEEQEQAENLRIGCFI